MYNKSVWGAPVDDSLTAFIVIFVTTLTAVIVSVIQHVLMCCEDLATSIVGADFHLFEFIVVVTCAFRICFTVDSQPTFDIEDFVACRAVECGRAVSRVEFFMSCFKFVCRLGQIFEAFIVDAHRVYRRSRAAKLFQVFLSFIGFGKVIEVINSLLFFLIQCIVFIFFVMIRLRFSIRVSRRFAPTEYSVSLLRYVLDCVVFHLQMLRSFPAQILDSAVGIPY